jgi:hypothetical protein
MCLQQCYYLEIKNKTSFDKKEIFNLSILISPKRRHAPLQKAIE